MTIVSGWSNNNQPEFVPFSDARIAQGHVFQGEAFAKITNAADQLGKVGIKVPGSFVGKLMRMVDVRFNYFDASTGNEVFLPCTITVGSQAADPWTVLRGVRNLSKYQTLPAAAPNNSVEIIAAGFGGGGITSFFNFDIVSGQNIAPLINDFLVPNLSGVSFAIRSAWTGEKTPPLSTIQKASIIALFDDLLP